MNSPTKLTSMRILGADPLVYALLFLGMAFSIVVGYVAQQRTLMPVINALLLWPFLIWSLRHARIDLAVRLVCFWAFVIFLGAVAAGRLLGQEALTARSWQRRVQCSTDVLADWTSCGRHRPAGVWLPPFLRRTGLTLAGSALTAGLIPLLVGARELAILGLWTANLFGASSPLAPLLALAPWTWAEIAAFIALGVGLADPIVTGDVHGLLTRDRARLLLTGLAALLLALLLHLLLPPLWAALLRPLVTLP